MIDLALVYQYIISDNLSLIWKSIWISLWVYVLLNYYLAINTKPGTITQVKESEKFNIYCSRCEQFRPQRAHHCRTCKTCILRFDHHCYYLENCVGFYNQGHFVRLLISTSIASSMTLSMIANVLFSVIFKQNAGALQVVLIIANLVVLLPTTITILLLTFSQMKLLLMNLTTIEDIERQDDIDLGMQYVNPYDMGYHENVQQILGERWLFWILPTTKMNGNGIDFKHINPYDL